MDACCKKIAELLCQGSQSSPGTLARLIERTGLARSTAMAHLRHLEEASFLVKEEILRGSVGRPKTLYKPSPKMLEELSKTNSD